MSQKKRVPRKKKATSSNGGGKVSRMPTQKRTLNVEESLQVQLVEARSLVVQKNNAISAMQSRYSARIQYMAKHVSELEAEVQNLTAELMKRYNDMEGQKNSKALSDLGIQGRVQFSQGPDGLYTCEPVPEEANGQQGQPMPQPQAPPQPQQEPVSVE